MIRLEETQSEYLLQISISQKERAKKIPGRRWDPDRVRWVYPKTRETLSAILKEFSPTEIEIEPKVYDRAMKYHTSKNNNVIIDRVEVTQDKPDKNKELLTEENEKLSKMVENLEKKNVADEKEIELLKKKIIKLEGQLESSQAQVQMKFGDEDKFHIGYSLLASSNDDKFLRLTKKLKKNYSYAMTIVNELEIELDYLLGHDNNGICDLINQAKKAEIFTGEDAELAHMIRKQRNLIAHDKDYFKTYKMRDVLCLYAASLIWPKIPDKE